jgi:hypothetical protein
MRFLFTLAVLAGIVGAAMFYLAYFVEPNPREMTVRIPADRLEPKPILPPAAPPSPPVAAAPTEETPTASTPAEPPTP